MADNSKKVSELPTTTNAASTDRILILRSPASNASVRTITANNLANAIATLLPTVVPNSAVTSNSVTLSSNGTTPVSFFTFSSQDATNVKFHCNDFTTGDITVGEIYCAANSSEANIFVNTAEVGANKIKFDPAPTINSSANSVTLYFRRDSAATSNVTIRYTATYF